MAEGVEYSEQTQCLCECYMIDGDEYSEQTQCLCECYTIDGVIKRVDTVFMLMSHTVCRISRADAMFM